MSPVVNCLELVMRMFGHLWCSAGVGRTGTFILIDRLLQHIQRESTIDIFGTILEMRGYRSNMIQTEVHTSVLCFCG